MKKLLIAAMATAAFAATPAFANDVNNQINISATVGNACGVGNHISGSGTAAGWTPGDIGGINLADGNGQFNAPIVAGTNRSFGNLWCNAPATVTIEVTPLTTPTTVSDTGSFTNRFEVEVTTRAVVYAGQPDVPTVVSSANLAVTGNSGHAFETGTGQYGGASLIRIMPAARGAGGFYRPLAGSYSSYVRISASVS